MERGYMQRKVEEPLHYNILTLSLASARTDEKIAITGDTITVLSMTGTDASIKLNHRQGDSIDLTLVRSLKSPFKTLFLTNTAQAEKNIILAIGGDASFQTESSRLPATTPFFYGLCDEDGSKAYFSTSVAVTDTPTVYLGVDTAPHKIPPTLSKGVITGIHVMLDPTNPVTITALRVWSHSIPADVHSKMHILYDSTWDFPAGLTDAVAYDIETVKSFILQYQGKIFIGIEYTGAPGVTKGFVDVSGIAHL